MRGYDRTTFLRLVRWMTIGLTIFAVASYIIQYVENFSLWQDEAYLALNIVQRDVIELLTPLSYNQAAPLGFLIVTEILTQLLGTGEYALRLFPLIYGLLTIALFVQLSRSFSPLVLLFGIALLATSPLHLRYTAEFKQYIGDGFWALWILYLSQQWLSATHKSSRLLVTLLVVGMIAVWFSHPSIFVLASAGIILLFHAHRQRDWKQVPRLILMGTLWLTSFSIVYLTTYRRVTSSSELSTFMNAYWESAFITPDITSVLIKLFEVFVWIVGMFQPVLLIIVIYGLVLGIVKARNLLVSLVMLPMIFMFIASLLELYPIANRMVLFLMPSLMLLVAMGWSHMIEQISRRHLRVATGLTILLLLLILSRVQLPFISSDTSEAREALAWIASVDDNAPITTSPSLEAVAAYYNYNIEIWRGQYEAGTHYWYLTDKVESQPNLADVENESLYEFRNIIVVCSPSPQTDCPSQR